MDDKHDPNGSVPIGTFTATSDDGELEIPIEIVVDDEIEERELAIEAGPDDAWPHSHGTAGGPLFDPPRRQRVATLLGVPLPGVGAASSGRTILPGPGPAKARLETSASVDDSLEESPTSIYGFKRSSLAELEQLVEAELADVPSSESASEIIGVVGRSNETGTFEVDVHELPEPRARRASVPVLAPAQFVEASARDAKVEQANAEALARDLVNADRAREQPTVVIARRTESAARDRLDSEPPVQKPKSSLAPVEVKRTRERAPVKRREPASAFGYALLAAMVLLGIGGWFVTAGGYRRSEDSAAQPTAAANVVRPADPRASLEPTAAPSVPSVPSVPSGPAPVVEAAPAVEEVVPTPTPAPAEPGSTRPRVASKTMRKKTGAPAPLPGSDQIETPSRDDVLNGLDRVRSTVRACAGGRNGVAEVDLTIAASGVVTNALVGGDFGGTPQGSCIARAVRRARFPTFKQDRYRVLFPYIL